MPVRRPSASVAVARSSLCTVPSVQGLSALPPVWWCDLWVFYYICGSSYTMFYQDSTACVSLLSPAGHCCDPISCACDGKLD